MSAESWDDLIRQARTSGNREIAVPLYERAYQLSRTFAENDPRRSESAFYHAMGLFTGGKRIEALNTFLEALEHCAGPDAGVRRYQSHQALAAIYFGLHDHSEAESHAKSALNSPERKSDPGGWEILQILAAVFLAQARYPEAVPHLEELVATLELIDPEAAPNTANHLALAHREMGDAAGELRWKKEYLRLTVLLQPRVRQVPTFPGGPEGWGEDNIGDFIETARNNEYSTFQRTPHDYARLLALQKRFEDSNRNLMLVLLERAQSYIDKGIDFADIEFPDAEWLDLFRAFKIEEEMSTAHPALGTKVKELYEDTIDRGAHVGAIWSGFK